MLTKKQESHIQASKMRFLRAVKGCTRQDKFGNIKIRKELQIYSLTDKRKENYMRWKEHIERMDPH